MQVWDVAEIETPGGMRSPVVLETADGARAIVIRLAAGEELGDHQVRERAWLTVVEGSVRVNAGAETVHVGPATVLTFDRGERHSIASDDGARVVLILSSWPGEGHYPSASSEAAKV